MVTKFYFITRKFFKKMVISWLNYFLYLHNDSKPKQLNKSKLSFTCAIQLLLCQIVLNYVFMVPLLSKAYILNISFVMNIIKLFNLFQKFLKKLSITIIDLQKTHYYIFVGLYELFRELFSQYLFTKFSNIAFRRNLEEIFVLNKFHLLLTDANENNEVKKEEFTKKDTNTKLKKTNESKISNKQFAPIKPPATTARYDLSEKNSFLPKKDPDEGFEKFFGGIVIFIVAAVVIMKYGNEWFGSTPVDIKNSPFYVPSAFESFMKTISDFFKNTKK